MFVPIALRGSCRGMARARAGGDTPGMTALPLPPAPDPDDPRARSIAELEGVEVPPGAYGLGSLAWLSRALVSPLAHLGPAELRLLLAHGRGVRWLLPLVVERLEREPFAAGDRGAGDLLVAALTVDPEAWAGAPALRDRLARVVHAARAQVHVLAEPARTRVADDLEAAREQFGF